MLLYTVFVSPLRLIVKKKKKKKKKKPRERPEQFDAFKRTRRQKERESRTICKAEVCNWVSRIKASLEH